MNQVLFVFKFLNSQIHSTLGWHWWAHGIYETLFFAHQCTRPLLFWFSYVKCISSYFVELREILFRPNFFKIGRLFGLPNRQLAITWPKYDAVFEHYTKNAWVCDLTGKCMRLCFWISQDQWSVFHFQITHTHKNHIHTQKWLQLVNLVYHFYPRPVLAFGYCHRLRLWVCVYQSQACPHDNSSLIQARITKFGPEMQNTLV